MKIAFVDKNRLARFAQFKPALPDAKFFYRDDSLVFDIRDYRPDVVFICKGTTFTPSNLFEIAKKYPSVYFYGDMRRPLSELVTKIAASCTITLVNWKDSANYSQLKHAGAKNIYCIRQGVDIELFYPIYNIEKKYDVTFGGGFYRKRFPGVNRAELVRYLIQNGISVQPVGPGWPPDLNPIARVGAKDLNIIYNQSKVTIGSSHFNDTWFYTSNRLYQCMAVGTAPHVTWHAPGVAQFFERGYLEVCCKESMKIMVDLLLSDEIMAKRIAAIQRQEILRDHTIEHAWARMKEIIERHV